MNKHRATAPQTRIDHFRAFAGYWAVPATETTAMNGKWKTGPGLRFFEGVRAKMGDLKVTSPPTPSLAQYSHIFSMRATSHAGAPTFSRRVRAAHPATRP